MAITFPSMITRPPIPDSPIPGRSGAMAKVYVMPLDVTIHYADGTAETRVVQNNLRKQSFAFTLAKQPTRLVVDENDWVLKKLKGN